MSILQRFARRPICENSGASVYLGGVSGTETYANYSCAEIEYLTIRCNECRKQVDVLTPTGWAAGWEDDDEPTLSRHRA